MSDSFTDYLQSQQNQPVSFTDYLELNSTTAFDSPSFTDYLSASYDIDNYRTNVLPKKDELSPSSPMGLTGSFFSGLSSGASLGYFGADRTPEEYQAMTTGEKVAETVGNIAGGTLPFLGLSLLTGGVGTPVAGAKYMKDAYRALNLINKNKKAVDASNKTVRGIQKQLSKSKGKQRLNLESQLKKQEKIQNNLLKESDEATKQLQKYKKDYIQELIDKGRDKEARRLSKSAFNVPTTTGLLSRSKNYREFIEGLATKETGVLGLKGADLANAANRFINNAAVFSAVGLASNKPGEGLMDRLVDIPKDVVLGSLFSATNLPRLYGFTSGKFDTGLETAGVIGVGAFGDYLSLSPDENMDIKDRLINGITMGVFHLAGQGLSNRFIKERTFDSLIKMGFDEEVAFELSYKSKYMDDTLVESRKFYGKEGILFKAKDSNDIFAVKRVRKSGENGQDGATISYVNTRTGLEDVMSASSITQAKNKWQKRFSKFDVNDESLIDELSPSQSTFIKSTKDFLDRRVSDLTKENYKENKEINASKITAIQQSIERLKKVKENPNRAFDIVEMDYDSLPFMKGKSKVYDYRKDSKQLLEFFEDEQEYLKQLFKDNNEDWAEVFKTFKGMKGYPDRYKWLSYKNRDDLRRKITSETFYGKGRYDINTAETIAKRMHNIYRKNALKKDQQIESNFPVLTSKKDYSKGDYVVILEPQSINKRSQYGTLDAIGKKATLAEILETDYKKIKPDDYIPVPNRSTVRVRTYDNLGNEVIMNISAFKTETANTKFNKRGDSLPKAIKEYKDWDINNLDKSIKTPKRPASFYKLPKEKQGEVLFNEFSSGKPNETFGLKGKSETFWDRYTEPGYKPKTVFEEFMFENYGKEIKQFKEKLTKQIRDSIKDDKDVWSAELWNARRGVIPPIDMLLSKFFAEGGYKSKGNQPMDLAWANNKQKQINNHIDNGVYMVTDNIPLNKEIFKKFPNASPVSVGLTNNKVYVPKLKVGVTNKDGEVTGYKPFDTKDFAEPRDLAFSSEPEARNYMRDKWESTQTGNKQIDNVISNQNRKAQLLQSESNEGQTLNKEYAQVNNLFTKEGYGRWDKEGLINLLYPQSKGNINRLSARQLQRVKEFVKDEVGSENYYDSVVFNDMSKNDNWFTKYTTPATNKIYRAMGKAGLPLSTVFELTNTNMGKNISFKLKEFSRWRTDVLGAHIEITKGMERTLKKLKGPDINKVNSKIQAFLDPKYAKLKQDPEYIKFAESLGKIQVKEGRATTNGLDYVINQYRALNDMLATTMISSNSFIKNSKTGKYERFFNIVDSKGREVDIIDFYKNPELHTAQVNSFLQYAKGKTKKVINDKGNRVDVDSKKSKNYYEQDYSRRVISDDFKEIMSDDTDAMNEIVRKVMDNDPEFKMIKNIGEREKAVVAHLLNVKNMMDETGLYGQQFTRVADLPTHLFRYIDESGGKRIIQLGKDGEFKASGGIFKKGDTVRDIHGQNRKISEVLPVYESEYGKLMQNYSDAVAHSSASYNTYFVKQGKKRTEIISLMSESIGNQVKDPSMKGFTEKALKLQMKGDKANWFSRIAVPLTRWNAIAGLSSPISGFKNLMLGNIQNATVFTGRDIMNSFNSTVKGKIKYEDERAWAERIGATYTGAYDLYLGEVGTGAKFAKKYLPNVGFMRTTEIFNRTVSNTLGRVALDTHVENLAGFKNPRTKGVSASDSRRIMMDVFEFNEDQVLDLIRRRKRLGKNGHDKMQYFQFEEKRARDQAHIITQGSGEAPYVPYWMGKNWARPLTLFYRIAYRITDTVAKNVIKPTLVDGNFAGAMKYLPLSIGAGYALSQVYNWAFDEQRTNKFKELPAQYFDYFLKAEGLALFSNIYEEDGSLGLDSFKPVVIRNAEVFMDNLEAWARGTKTPKQAIGDGVKRIVSAANTADRVLQNITASDRKKFLDSRRRQTQYLNAFYPKAKLDIDFDGALTTKSPHYRMIKDVFWHTDSKDKAQRYYSALQYLTDRIMIDKRGINVRTAQKEAKERMDRVISRLRPIPSSWSKTKARTEGSRYREYMSRLTDEQKAEEEEIMNTYIQRKKEFYKAISQHRNLYYKGN